MPTADLFQSSRLAPAGIPNPPFQRLFRRLSPLERIRELYHRAQQPVNRSILENVLTQMRVEVKVSEADMARIPSTGAAIVTANHPFGLLDGAVLGALLGRVRDDVKVLTNFLLAGIPELHEHCIFVDPFGGSEAVARNRQGIRRALQWLSDGSMLVVFPAGEVSHIRFQDFGIVDPPWHSMAARLARSSGALVVPAFVPGCNSATFQTLGLLHPKLRTAWLLNEFLQQTGKTVEVRFGSRVSPEILRSAGSDREAAGYLRWRTYLLAQRGKHRSKLVRPPLGMVFPRKALPPIIAAVPPDAVHNDLERLSGEQCLFQNPEFAVYFAKAREIPNVTQELGRLRELTFREAGEGTGRPSDLDRFDHYYTHLVLWSKTKREIVGAYRLGLTTEILPRVGVPGFYTSTLFRYDPRLFERIGPALELGRSFVRPEYQKQYAPLLALWKGIGRYIALNPQFAILFGAVSISSRYNRLSRELIFRFFQTQERDAAIAGLVAPRRPFRPRRLVPSIGSDLCRGVHDLDHLADPIADVENDGKSIPILIKHYAKLGGRILSFNVDRDFSNVLDGLVLVDLRRSDPVLLQRYMGEDGLRAFSSYHGLCS
jgi:putative hemolysin